MKAIAGKTFGGIALGVLTVTPFYAYLMGWL